jgi:hypothetical protein
VKYSEQFDNASWTKTEVNLTPNDSISPQGLLNAYSIIETTANNRHRIYKIISKATSAQDYCFSVFVKNNSGNRNVRLNLESGIAGNKATVVFNTSGSLILSPTVSGSFANATYFVEKIGDYWKYTLKATSDTSNLLIPIFLLNNGTTEVYLGDGTSGVYIWGAQLEAGSYPTSYIPTTSAAVTRVADAAYKTGISSLIGQSEGTLYWEGYIDTAKANYGFFPRLTMIGNGTGANFAGVLLTQSNQLTTRFVISNSNQATITHNITTSGTYKIAFAYKANDFVLYVNGVNVGTDTSGTVTGLSNLYIGYEYGDGSTPPVHPTNQAALFKTRLTNDQLAALTTL